MRRRFGRYLMSPDYRLYLIELELERWLMDEREPGVRDAVHYDRVARILRFDTLTRVS